jgi:hypothetical protein
VRLNFQVPTRRLELDGICGNAPLRYADSGRIWSFRIPRATARSLRTCGRMTLTVTYGGEGALRGVRALFGFRLRAAR